jgi:hypothetical protein
MLYILIGAQRIGMMPTITEKIDDFLGKGRRVISQIMDIQSNVSPSSDLSEYKKLLLAAHLDGYSHLIYPRKGSRDRYVRFIVKFGKWPDAERLSLIHLSELLRRTPEPEFEDLRKEVKRRIALWTTSPFLLCNDPNISEIARYWPQDKDLKEPLLGVCIDKLRHASLFYTYRCSLAHSLRAPGFQWDSIDQDEPYYVSGIDNFDQEWKERWLLVYPLRFFHRMALNCMDSLETYLKSNEIDPYIMSSFGEFWLESLNEQ